jgi:hypothetical protein
MATIIIIYLSIGLILVSVGPLSKDLADEIKVTQPDNSKTYKIRKTLFTLTIIGVGILLYPIFYYSYFFQNGKKINNIKPKVYEEGKLYFDKIPGKGNIVCKDCEHTEIMISFTHGFDVKSNKITGESGCQCQDCGKLYEIFSFEKEKPIIKNCDCGGTLKRENALFCPKCKSFNVVYHLKFMT